MKNMVEQINEKPQSTEDSKITGGLTAFVGFALLLFGFSAWNLYDIAQGFRAISERNFRLEQLKGTIVHLDEVLTMSARMSSTTGDPQWEKRYYRYQPLLNAALEESTKIAPDAYRNLPSEVYVANQKLEASEGKAFQLVREGKKEEAYKILFNTDYQNQKEIYAAGASKTSEIITNQTTQQLKAFSDRLGISLVFTLLCLPVIVGAYFVALRLIRAYLGDRDRALVSLANLEQETVIAAREQERNQQLQSSLVSLLSDVEGIASGDLTVRAQITADDIGIVADFFNAIIENLRDVVTQVKLSATQVNSSVGNNDAAIRQLTEEAIAQASQITDTLESIEEMTLSIQQVAKDASEAADASQVAANTAEAGGVAMAKTVSSIVGLRETVAETAKKVKRLGESSQQISKVVALIDQIALKTNMLAVNASIEAARAGEEGKGFAVVAEEVGALAAQSTSATKEIGRIVESIQRETGEVVEAMEASTTQVVEGTKQVEEAKQSLGQILAASRQVNELFQSISTATTSQVNTSEIVKKLMAEVAAISQRSSSTSLEVSQTLQETVEITKQLQASVGAFKLS